MKYLPIFLDLQHNPCLIVGGGEVARRKLRLLRQAGALVTVIAPRICDLLQSTAKTDEGITLLQQPFTTQAMDGFALVIAATNQTDVNAKVAEAARAYNIPVNIVDQPRLGNFILPSIIDRSPVQIAVSTAGTSPVLARLLRTRLESMLPANYGQLAELVARYRGKVAQLLGTVPERRRFWERELQGRVAELVFSGQAKAAEHSLQKSIDQATRQTEPTGEVYLVGAGPGDPDLLTFRALRLMQQADVVLYDRLVSPPILEMTRRDAERIYVGKERANHAVPQEQINDMLVRLAKTGKRVLRLKGGDPFMFGRGGEEIGKLAKSGISFQVVPGITAAAGCAAYAGIPLTHRDHAQSCIFVTGHLRDGSINLNWKILTQPQQTVVIYMGLSGLPQLCSQLIEHGLAQDTPAALVQQGTTSNQRVFTGNLGNLPDLVQNHSVKAPTLVIVGDVVKLHQQLSWFHAQPSQHA
ncbi:MAG TPA: uroporphyrinogen-III C-methyltransferase [Gammaproteobacteria bacterium]|nr:uroporphyrinogen-III C-methyltransferase [Gammaproteobacteria bacterium]